MRLPTALAALLPVALLSSLASAQDPVVHSVLFTSGVSRPTYMCSPPGDLHRAFVTEQWTGNIRVVKDGVLQATPFLNITGLATGNEQGLLSMAFHPNYAVNGKFYVYFNNSAGTIIVRQYTVSANPDVADAASALQILQIAHPTNTNHNGGCLQFGPDGYLYFATGDGGGGNDVPNNAQTLTVLLGKMIRIDVDGDDFPADATKNYAIPPTNPFAGATFGSDEIYHFGLRNPWRWSFDRLTGEILIGDVGQDAFEEVDFAPAGQGGMNFGWRCTEGKHCTSNGGCTCDLTGATLTMPFQEFPQAATLNCTVIGGYVYRGNDIPALQGSYFCADYCAGTIWSMRYAGFGTVQDFQVRTAQLDPAGAATISSIVSFAEDARGEMYIIEQSGEIWRIAGPPPGVANCPGDGTVPGGQVACPCGNNGGAGRGCANSSNATGALLSADGATNPDGVRFTCAGMPATAFCIFAKTDGFDPLGVVYGDGVWCLNGTLIRLRSKTATVGVTYFPEPGDPFNVSTRGNTPVGSGFIGQYGVFYRNAASTYCTPATFNASNGYTITW